MRNLDDEIAAWFAGRVPEAWFEGAPDVTVDRDEILVVGMLEDVELEGDATDQTRAVARASRIQRFREETREERMRVAGEAESLYSRKVSWGALCGGRRTLFTHLGIPTMTRLRLTERLVLDTLIKAGVARNRSDALAWCVRLVARNQSEWLDGLQRAFEGVEKVRSEGPDV